MARNYEKGRSMLHQWARLKSGFDNNERRPGNTKMCDNVNDAEKWRRDVMKEISKYTNEISNPDLADDTTKVRELNDRINKLLRIKFYWEKRIIELGGVDHIRASNSRNRGRKQMYFGVAKQLPEAQANNNDNAKQGGFKPRVSLSKLNQRLTNDYYGIGHENQTMLSEEAAIEKQLRARKLVELKKQQAQNNNIIELLTNEELEILSTNFILENLPTQQGISDLILEQKKANLLSQYM
jgi:pre-mRNA-splicing factor ISY1